MPGCRSCMKDETVSSCIKSRNPLGIIVLVLLLVSAAFAYTIYYVSNTSAHHSTSEPFSQALSHFITEFSRLNWCPNASAINSIFYSGYTNENDTNIAQESSLSRHTACLQVVTIIAGDYYPVFRNISLYRATLLRSQLFNEELGSANGESSIKLTYLIQHNLSTSTRHSTDVLVPTYINISSSRALPRYISDASTCRFRADRHVNKTVSISSCRHTAPFFHIDHKWEHDLDIFVSVEDAPIKIHLMYTSYFLLITAISVIAYSTIRNRNSSKNSNKNKLPQKIHLVVY